MGGGESPSGPSYPPPIDYSSAMLNMSENNKQIAMSQIEANKFAMTQASMDRQMQMAANLELGLERLDTKLQVAKLNYLQFMTEEENRHEEKMTEIGSDVDAARYGVQETSDFLSDGAGGYTPGGIWEDATTTSKA